MKIRALALLLGFLAAGCCHNRNQNETSAFFEVGFTNGKERYVIKLVSPQRIAEARLLIGMDPEKAPHVIGTIVAGRESYNPKWRFYLEPGSIQFVINSIEKCDGTIKSVDENLDQPGSLFPPGATWCCWSSRVLRELP